MELRGQCTQTVRCYDTVPRAPQAAGEALTSIWEQRRMAKHIFVTGGVVSSLGKGITTGAVGLILKRMGLTVRLQKLDPYLNVDPGTMNPYEHGEVYVTEDGAETDLDLGHYERFTGDFVTRDSNYTMGQIYSSVIAKERKGDFLGKTVQVVPHTTDEIKACIRRIAHPGVDVECRP